jgi:hypothetical protein
MSDDIDKYHIHSLVNIFYDKYDYKYKKDSNNIIEDLKQEIENQKDQLDFMIDLLSLNKNYRKEVSTSFNQKYMKHIGKEVYKKYPNRIKLFEYALIQIENKNNQIKEKDMIILFQNLIIIASIIIIIIISFI